MYAFVTLQIDFIDEPTNRIEYKLSIPEEFDEYHLQAVRATDLFFVCYLLAKNKKTEISEVKSALEQGIALGLERGGIKGVPVTNCKVTILQVIRDVGENSTVALTAATAKAVWNALEKCARQARGEVKDFQSPKIEPLWIDFDEEANRWNLNFANYLPSK